MQKKCGKGQSLAETYTEVGRAASQDGRIPRGNAREKVLAHLLERLVFLQVYSHFSNPLNRGGCGACTSRVRSRPLQVRQTVPNLIAESKIDCATVLYTVTCFTDFAVSWAEPSKSPSLNSRTNSGVDRMEQSVRRLCLYDYWEGIVDTWKRFGLPFDSIVTMPRSFSPAVRFHNRSLHIIALNGWSELLD